MARRESVVEYAALEHCVRDVLNRTAPRRMAVLRPAQGRAHQLPRGPGRGVRRRSTTPRTTAAGTRQVPFSRELWIEREDFMEDPPKKFFRLSPGREVRLRSAYFITCQEVVKDAARRGGRAALHLRPGHARRQRARRPLAQGHAALGLGARTPSPARCGSTTTSSPAPTRAPTGDLLDDLNPQSEEVLTGCRLEPALGGLPAGARACSSSGWATSAWTRTRPPERPVFNRIVTLRDTWARVQAKQK